MDGFKICRACLKPSTEVNLSSIFAENGEKAEIFRKVSGVDVSLLTFGSCRCMDLFTLWFYNTKINKYFNKHDELICDGCWATMVKLEKFLGITQTEFHFKLKRDEVSFSKSEDADIRFYVCRCCLAPLTTSLPTMMSASTSKKLSDITGVDVSL